ncbi:MAG: adenylate/guanylate cyclase domain-containing protein [Acidimicrobiia bacterium]
MEELTAIEQAIAALEEQRAALGDAVADTALQPLLDKRHRLLAAPSGEQRKLVTVLFADVVDFTVLSGQLDPEDMREIMSEYFAAWRSAIEDEGGAVEKFIGDAVVAVFGLNRAHEDDPHRAVRAALALGRSLEDLNRRLDRRYGIELSMRVGIDTGEVVISTLGERGDGDYVVVGDRVNRAARIQASAPPGGILLSADTGRHIRGSFGLRLVEGLQLKGFDEAVDAFLVVSGENQGFWLETRGIEGVATTTVGRELELGRLDKLFADVADDRSHLLVTVLGDAGIGKSRVIRDFESNLANLPDGVWLLRGRAAPTTEHVPNGLLRGIFAERLDIQDSDDPDTVTEKWHAGVASLLGIGDAGARAADVLATWLGFQLGGSRVEALKLDPEALQRQAHQTVLELLARIGERAPVVVLLEDLHWADDATLDWLESFNPKGTSLLIVASARPDLLRRRPHWGEGLDQHTSVRLGPLSNRESRQLVDEIMSRASAVPESLRSLVVEAAEGNPFFIEELVKWFLETGIIVEDSEGWTVADGTVADVQVPGTLRGVLQARLDSLDRGHRSVIDRASVVGRVFWDEAVAELGGDSGPPPPDAYERLRANEVVFQRPTSMFEGTQEYSFRHSLMREVAYENVLHSSRRRYHARAAEGLERVSSASQRPDEHAAVIAGHYDEAGDGPAAARWYLTAGRHAAGTFANRDALRLLESAVELTPEADVDLRFDTLMACESVLDRTAARDEQRKVIDELREIDGVDDTRLARLRLCEGRWHFNHGEYATVAPFVGEAVELAGPAGQVELELEALALGAKSLAFGAEHDASRSLSNELVVKANDAGNQRMRGEGLRLLAVVATNLGETKDAVALLDEARAAHHAIDDLEGEALVVGQLGATYIQMGGHLDEARRVSEEAMAMFVATGHRLRLGIVQGNLAAIAIEQGRLDDALELAVDNLELATEVEDAEGVVSAYQRLGDIRRCLGNNGEARRLLEEGIAIGRQLALHYFVTFSLAALVQVDLAEGLVAAAVAHAAEAETAAALAEAPHPEVFALQWSGIALYRSGDLPAAEAKLRRGADGYRSIGRPDEAQWVEAVLAEVLLDAGEVDEALRFARGVLPLVERDVYSEVEGAPFLISLHRVLEALDPEAATEVARGAGRFHGRSGGQIADEEVRAALLSTPGYRRLAELAATAA